MTIKVGELYLDRNNGDEGYFVYRVDRVWTYKDDGLINQRSIRLEYWIFLSFPSNYFEAKRIIEKMKPYGYITVGERLLVGMFKEYDPATS